MGNNDAPAGVNRVTNDWMRSHAGKRVRIKYPDGKVIVGDLIRWDTYAVLVNVEYGGGKALSLILKAPGMEFVEDGQNPGMEISR